MSEENIESHLYSISELLNSKKYYYEIPKFQRPYSWEDSNLNDFLMDVESIKVYSQESASHFMGSVVLYSDGFRDGHEEAKVFRRSIIDGQQRITTSLILLCALRDVAYQEVKRLQELHDDDLCNGREYIERLKEIVKDIEEGLYSKNENGVLHEGRIEEFRYVRLGYNPMGAPKEAKSLEILLKGPNENFELWNNLRKEISEEASRSGTSIINQQKILYAYNKFFKHIENKISRLDEGNKRHTYLKILKTQVGSLKFINILLNNMYSAYNIFMTLNDRGMDLDNSDLIKSHIIRRMHREPMDTILVEWRNLIDILNGSIEYKSLGNQYSSFSDLQKVEVDKFFIAYAYLRSFKKPSGHQSITAKNVFRCYEESLEEDSEFKKFVANMTMEAKVYRLVYDPYCYYVYSDPIFAAGDVDKEREFAKVAEHLSVLKHFKIRQHAIFAYLLLRLAIIKPDGMDEGVLDLKYVARVFKELEIFHFKYNILLKVSGNTFTKLYEKAAKEISAVISGEITNLEDLKHVRGEVCSKVKDLMAKLSELLDAQEMDKDKFIKLFSNMEYSERKTPGNKMSTVGGKYFKMDKGGESTLIIRYILSKYQPSMQGSMNDPLTIEHIYPHSKRSDFGDRSNAVNAIGNLMLLQETINNKLEDKDVKDKINGLKPYYGPHEPNFDISKEWSADLIDKRTRKLAEYGFNNVWKMVYGVKPGAKNKK